MRQTPARATQQPIARKRSERQDIDMLGKITIYGGFEFNIEIHECLGPMDSVMIARTVQQLPVHGRHDRNVEG